MAPGARIIAYRVCLDRGCYSSDSVSAIQQAVVDGVDVINFSISGGADPFSDPVELAFLDAYAAGIDVNASAGNSGPGPGTAEHAGPWVTTVGASYGPSAFMTSLQLRASDGTTLSLPGSTITHGVAGRTVVSAADVSGYGDPLCSTPMDPGSVANLVVVCERGTVTRIEKSLDVRHGGAAGMILYNPSHQDLFTDNFWIPTVMLEGPEPANTLRLVPRRARDRPCHLGHRRTGSDPRRPDDDLLVPRARRWIHQAGRHGSRTPGARRGHARSRQRRVRAAGAVVPVHRRYLHVQPVRRRRGRAHPGGPPELDPRSGEVGPHDVCAADRDEGGRRHARRSFRRRRRIDPRGSRRAADVDVRCPRKRFRRRRERPARLARPQPPEHRRDGDAGNDLHDPLWRERQQVVTNVHGDHVAPEGATIVAMSPDWSVAPGATLEIDIEIVGQALADGQYFGSITLQPSSGANEITIPVAFAKTSG